MTINLTLDLAFDEAEEFFAGFGEFMESSKEKAMIKRSKDSHGSRCPECGRMLAYKYYRRDADGYFSNKCEDKLLENAK